MTKLVFGVIDLPYADKSYRKVGKTKPQGGLPEGSMTTGDVADILEKKYGVFQTFFDLKKPEIAEVLTEAYAGAAETLLMGGQADLDPSGDAGEKIIEMFRDALTNRELDGKIPGVPTMASQEGVSHRFKDIYNRKGKKSRKNRPSFIDTGLYEGSARAEIENDPD